MIKRDHLEVVFDMPHRREKFPHEKCKVSNFAPCD